MLETFKIKRISELSEMLDMLPLLKQLSPTLTLESYEAMLRQMIPHNYYQVAIFDGEQCVAVSGYWLATKLYSGKYIEVDNFVVSATCRSQGLGKLLLNWMKEEGRRNNCKTMLLDAYAENHKAHLFYHREGFHIRGFHYLLEL